MGNSTVISIKGDVKDLEAKLQAVSKSAQKTFGQYEKSVEAVNVSEKELTETLKAQTQAIKPLQNEIAELTQKKANGVKLTKEENQRLKELNSQLLAQKKLNKANVNSIKEKISNLKRLRSAQKGEYSNTVATARALKQETRSRSGVSKAIDKQVRSLRKENAERRAMGTSLVRHIRRLESLAVAYYAITRAYQASFGAGVELNRQYENMELGLSALISAKTKAIDLTGKEIDVAEKFVVAQQKTKAILDDIKKASLDTPASFMEMTGFYQQAIGHALASGKAFGENLEQISDNTIILTKRMSSLGASMGMGMELINEEIRSLMSGDVSRDSKLALVLFGSPTVANKAIADAKKQVNGLTDLFDKMLSPFKQLESIMTFDKQYRHMMYWIDEIRRNASEPMFDDLQASMATLTSYLKDNGDEITTNILEAYDNVKYATEFLTTTFNTLSSSIENIVPSGEGIFTDIVDDMNILETSVYGINVGLIAMSSLIKNLVSFGSNFAPTGNVFLDMFNFFDKDKVADFNKNSDSMDDFLDKIKKFTLDYKKLTSTDLKAKRTQESTFSNMVMSPKDEDELIKRLELVYKVFEASVSGLDKTSEAYIEVSELYGKTYKKIVDKYTASQARLEIKENANKNKADAKELKRLKDKRKALENYYKHIGDIDKAWKYGTAKDKVLTEIEILKKTGLLTPDELDKYLKDMKAQFQEASADDDWFKGWDTTVTQTLVQSMQDAFDGDFDFESITKGLTGALGSAFLSQGIGSAGTTDASGKVTGASGVVGGSVGGWAGIGAGIGLMALGSLFGGGGEKKSQAEIAQEEFDKFIDGLSDASDALYAFGNTGSAISNQITELQREISSKQSIIASAEASILDIAKITPTGTKRIKEATVERKAELTADERGVIAQAEATMTLYMDELSDVITSSLADTLDISALTTPQLEKLVSGIDIEAMEEWDTQLNNIAFAMKTGTETAEDIADATRILSDTRYADYLNYAEAIDVLAESMSDATRNATAWTDTFKSQEEILQDLLSNLTSQLSEEGSRTSEQRVWEVGTWGFGGSYVERMITEVFDIITDNTLTLATSMDELDALFVTLSTDIDALTDSDLEFLNANRMYIEQLDAISTSLDSTVWETFATDAERLTKALDQVGLTDLPNTFEEFESIISSLDVTSIDTNDELNSFTEGLSYLTSQFNQSTGFTIDLSDELTSLANTIGMFEGSVDDIYDTITKLRSGATTSDVALSDFYRSLDATSALVGGDSGAFQESLAKTIDLSSVLYDSDAFTSLIDQQYAQSVSANRFEAMQSDVEEEIDILKQIEENTRTSIALPSFAVGTSNVTSDMIANIHKGEMIVPATFSEGIRSGDVSIGNNDAIISEVKVQNDLLYIIKDELVKSKYIQQATYDKLNEGGA